MPFQDFLAIGVRGSEPDKAERDAFLYSQEYVVERHGRFHFVDYEDAVRVGRYDKRVVFFVSSIEMLVSAIGNQKVRTLELVAHGGVSKRSPDDPEFHDAGELEVGPSGMIRFKVEKAKVDGNRFKRTRLGPQGPEEQWVDLVSPVEAEVDGIAYLLDLLIASRRTESCLPHLRKLTFEPNAEITLSGCSVGRDPDFLRAFSLACHNVPVRAGISKQIVAGSRAPGAGMFAGLEGNTLVCKEASVSGMTMVSRPGYSALSLTSAKK
jgi:hypothetical protein